MRYTWDYLSLHVWRRDYISLLNKIVLWNCNIPHRSKIEKIEDWNKQKYNCNRYRTDIVRSIWFRLSRQNDILAGAGCQNNYFFRSVYRIFVDDSGIFVTEIVIIGTVQRGNRRTGYCPICCCHPSFENSVNRRCHTRTIGKSQQYLQHSTRFGSENKICFQIRNKFLLIVITIEHPFRTTVFLLLLFFSVIRPI